MLRTPSTALAAALAMAGFAAPQAFAADLHWFYDGQTQGRYEDNEYNNGRYGERRYIPEPDYSVYRPETGYNGYDGDNSYNGDNRYKGDDGQRRRHRRHHRDVAQFSCLEGIDTLKQAGFRHIEVVECANGSYVYDAVRRRVPWRIEVSSASGDILDVERLGD